MYQHHAVKAVEFLIADIIKDYSDAYHNSLLDFFTSIHSFLLLTDNILINMFMSKDHNIKLLIEKLHCRNGYKKIAEYNMSQLNLKTQNLRILNRAQIIELIQNSQNPISINQGDKIGTFRYSLTKGYNPLSKIKL